MTRRLLPALLAVALLLVGCGTSGGSGAATTTTTTSSGGSTSSGASGSATTTSSAGPGGASGITTAQLEKVLPTAEEVGPDYTLDPAGDDTSGNSEATNDPAFEKACPEAAALDIGGTGAENDDEAKASFSADDDRGIEVSLDPTPVGMEPKDMAKVIDALNSCEDVELTEQGTKMTMSMAAKELSGHGDGGIDLTMGLTFTLLGAPLRIEFHGYIFTVDGVGVAVLATSGIDPDTMQVKPADDDLLGPLADLMEKRVKDL